MVTLRPYQVEAVRAVEDEWSKGRRKTLLGQATGTGKTVTFAKVAENCVRNGEKVLVLAHREELLLQAMEKIRDVTGIDCALEKAESTGAGSMFPVIVGSVQTLSQDRRLERFEPDYFGTVIVDEAHHALSESYQKVLKYFYGSKVLGVTATPDRGDKRNLGEYFDSMAFEYSMSQAIRDGYLVPVKAQLIPLEIDISSVGITTGDLNAGQTGSALEPYLFQIADEMARYCRKRKTVVFLPLVATSQKFCRILNDKGIRTAEVNGGSVDRKEILNDFEAGRYDVLCNSMLLTEGWDCPSVDCVVNLRPTKVRSLFQQIVGRGTRLFPGKKDLLLLDFLWQTERHDLCHPSCLVSRDEKIAEAVDKEIEENPDGVDLIEAEEKAESDAVRQREESLARELSEMRRKKRKLVDPLQYAMSISAEDLSSYTPTFAWEMGPPSKAQLELLEKRGIFADAVENAGKASMLIDRLIRRQQEGLSTPKQIRCLERYGFQHVGTWKFDQAKKIIVYLASHHWSLPNGFNALTYIPD